MNEAYIHCANCLPDKPDGVSPAEWVRLGAFIDTDDNTVYISCTRCGKGIVKFKSLGPQFDDFRGELHEIIDKEFGEQALFGYTPEIPDIIAAIQNYNWADFEKRMNEKE